MSNDQHLKQKTDELAAAIGDDYRHLQDDVQRISIDLRKLLRENTGEKNQANAILADVELEHLVPYNLPNTSFQNNSFTDLALGMTEWSEFDLLFNGDLLTDSSLKTAIIISLFTNAKVDGQQGWWGDDYREEDEEPIAASKLWTLMGKPPTPDNVRKGKRYAKETLQWLIDDNRLKSISIEAEHQQQGLDMLALHIIATSPNDQQFEYSLQF